MKRTLKQQQRESEVHNDRYADLLTVVLFCFFALIIIRNAWVSDDAYITLRTVDNFVNGYGLTWNPTERVQGYTHPLWMFVLSIAYFFTRESFFTTIGVSLMISVVAAFLFATRIPKVPLAASFCLLILSLSRAFTDYATSGLENPLTHLLLVVFYILYFRGTFSPRVLLWMSLTMSLGIFNRLDTLLLYAPALLVAFLHVRTRKGFYALVLGQLPIILWVCFATFYYGSPSPNTAYAKLNTRIPAQESLIQGFYYLLDSLTSDPLTMFTILSGLALVILSKDRRSLPLAAGSALYLLYTVSIGGDFMRGRFLAAPFLCAIILIARYDFSKLQPASMVLLVVAVVMIGLSVPYSTLAIPNVDFDTMDARSFLNEAGIADEMLFYYPNNGLLMAHRGVQMPDHVWKEQGLQLRATGTSVIVRNKSIGLYGFYAGPGVHIIDQLALPDPLLARLPAIRQIDWRIGHFPRVIPEGYIETLQFGHNVIADENLALYYDKLTRITRGRLFDPQRWLEIWRMNTGQYDDLIDFDTYRYPTMIDVALADVSMPKAEGTLWNDAGTIVFDDSGVEVALPAYSYAPRLEISLDRDDVVQLVYRRDGKVVATQRIHASFIPWEGLSIHHLEVPKKAAKAGYNSIRVLPVGGDENFSLGHITLWDPAAWIACAAQGTCPILFNTPAISQLLDKGWSAQEAWGTWSVGARSTMYVYVEPGHDYDLRIEAFPFEMDGLCDQSIKVRWNDRLLGEGIFTSCDAQTFVFTVPREAITGEQNTLQFQYKAFRTAQTTLGDQRLLGVGFTALHIAQK